MSKQIIVKAWVDSKEQKMVKKTIAFFKKQGIECQEKPLDDGDVLLLLSNQEYFAVERKSFSDFVQSYIKNDHLQDQAYRLNNSFKNYCCIVHGSIEDLYRIKALRRIKQPAVDKMAAKLELLYKLPIFWVDNEAKYFKKIMDLAEMIVKEDGAKVKAKSSISIKNRPDVNLLTAGDNIGTKTALILLKHFGTPQNVLNASREDLLKIRGVGEGTVSDVKKLKKLYEEGI